MDVVTGSGKTTWAKKMESRGFKHVNCDVSGLKHIQPNSVVDFINLRSSDRRKLVTYLRSSFPDEDIVLLWFPPNAEQSISRGIPEVCCGFGEQNTFLTPKPTKKQTLYYKISITHFMRNPILLVM